MPPTYRIFGTTTPDTATQLEKETSTHRCELQVPIANDGSIRDLILSILPSTPSTPSTSIRTFDTCHDEAIHHPQFVAGIHPSFVPTQPTSGPFFPP